MKSSNQSFITKLSPSPATRRSLLQKVRNLLRDELIDVQLRLRWANLLLWPLPLHAGGRIRAAILRKIGFHIGNETSIYGRPVITGSGNIYKRLVIGDQCRIDSNFTVDLEECVSIGNRVTIGHQVLILTSTHEIGPQSRRAGEVIRAPIRIEDGAWIGPRCLLLPGVTVGAGAVVATGALVNTSVPPNTCVAGAPARVVEEYWDSVSV